MPQTLVGKEFVCQFMFNLNLVKAYYQLLFPRVPNKYEGSTEQANARSKVLKQLSEGNVSAHLGKVTTKKVRDAKRENALAS